MKSTRSVHPAPYVGADLTDRFAGARPVDVCGLDGNLNATFWTWRWDEGRDRPIDVAGVMVDFTRANLVLIDGPQALAREGAQERECELILDAPGKTGDKLPLPGGAFMGYIRSSVELFLALDDAGLKNAREVYPGACWPALAGKWLAKKSTPEGVKARRDVLASFGVRGLPESPTHDQLDAALMALMAAAADGKVEGLGVKAVGRPSFRDADGILREGQMLVPVRLVGKAYVLRPVTPTGRKIVLEKLEAAQARIPRPEPAFIASREDIDWENRTKSWM